MYLINHYLEAFRTTVFRQTMFAEFERLSHAAEEKGEPLTSESLSKMYARLNRRYYGAEAVVDKEIALEWARIPHFYTAFYVYQYATGFSSAALIARNILHAAGGARAQDGPSPAQQYRRFLCGGGSDHPMELLKLAGVDLSTPEPVEAALEIFAEYVDKMEEALRG